MVEELELVVDVEVRDVEVVVLPGDVVDVEDDAGAVVDVVETMVVDVEGVVGSNS